MQYAQIHIYMWKHSLANPVKMSIEMKDLYLHRVHLYQNQIRMKKKKTYFAHMQNYQTVNGLNKTVLYDKQLCVEMKKKNELQTKTTQIK